MRQIWIWVQVSRMAEAANPALQLARERRWPIGHDSQEHDGAAVARDETGWHRVEQCDPVPPFVVHFTTLAEISVGDHSNKQVLNLLAHVLVIGDQTAERAEHRIDKAARGAGAQ